jgi:hypothetical protein
MKCDAKPIMRATPAEVPYALAAGRGAGFSTDPDRNQRDELRRLRQT